MRPGRSPETLVNGATVVHERLTSQTLMHHARSAVTAIAVEQPPRRGRSTQRSCCYFSTGYAAERSSAYAGATSMKRTARFVSASRSSGAKVNYGSTRSRPQLAAVIFRCCQLLTACST